jgi:hypothetical protein
MWVFRYGRASESILIALCAVILLCTVPRCVHAQTVEAQRCADGTLLPPNGNCRAYLCGRGWAQSHGLGYLCGASGAPPYGPSAAAIEAERAQQRARRQQADEQRRLAEQQRKFAEEQRLEREKKEQEREAWEASVKRDAERLKGPSTDDGQLKGVGANSNFFGLKGVSPEEATSNPNYGIRTGGLKGSPYRVSGAWEQLHCAATFLGDALTDLKKIETGEADARELDEIKFIAGKAGAIMHGGTVKATGECPPTGPMPIRLRGPQLAHEAHVVDGLLPRTVRDAETYVASRQKADALRQRLDTLKKATTTEKTTVPPAPPIQKGQTFSRSADQRRITAVYRVQKENERKKSNYLALLLTTQRALNEANSQKIASAADAEKVAKETQAILAGH